MLAEVMYLIIKFISITTQAAFAARSWGCAPCLISYFFSMPVGLPGTANGTEAIVRDSGSKIQDSRFEIQYSRFVIGTCFSWDSAMVSGPNVDLRLHCGGRSGTLGRMDEWINGYMDE